MLSILIPVFNFDVTALVRALHEQATREGIVFEIVLIDDASDTHFKHKNKELSRLSHVRYIEEATNTGRSKIRNRLADLAAYSCLLFMDCDSRVLSDTYIRSYLDHCGEEVVICGGRIYEEHSPPDVARLLRWKHGRRKEEFTAEFRNRYPNKSFMTNNFLITKALFDKIRFHEGINGYGHEDTLFGYELKMSNITVKHIDNPLIHIGLEDNTDFLEKTRESIRNLKYILSQNGYEKVLVQDIKLLAYYKFFERMRTKSLLKALFKSTIKSVEKNLLGKNPSLFLFDLYKLGYMCSLKDES